jgi:hypothetical protein
MKKKSKKKQTSSKTAALKPTKELQKAIDMFPKVVKRQERVAKEKAKIRKNFESANF